MIRDSTTWKLNLYLWEVCALQKVQAFHTLQGIIRYSSLFFLLLRSWVSKLETKGLPAAASETAFAAEWASMENDIAKVDLILQNVDSWNCWNFCSLHFPLLDPVLDISRLCCTFSFNMFQHRVPWSLSVFYDSAWCPKPPCCTRDITSGRRSGPRETLKLQLTCLAFKTFLEKIPTDLTVFCKKLAWLNVLCKCQIQRTSITKKALYVSQCLQCLCSVSLWCSVGSTACYTIHQAVSRHLRKLQEDGWFTPLLEKRKCNDT